MGAPPPILQANISMSDSLLLMVLALVVFGPRRLPQIGRQIGKLMYEFRKASNDFKFQMEEELRNAEEADRRKREEAERQQRLALAAQTQTAEAKTDAQPLLPEDLAPVSDAPGASATGSETPTEAGVPRILPPSTGEVVGASRAGRAAANANENDPAPAAIAPEEEATAKETQAVTEQASRHG